MIISLNKFLILPYFKLPKCGVTTFYINKLKKKKKINKYFFFFFFKKLNTNFFSIFLYYQFINIFYLKNIFNINLKEKNINSLTTLPLALNKFIIYETNRINYNFFGIKYFNEIAYLFLINIWLKNIKNICIYMEKKLNTIHFKKHRIYFLFFFRILNKYILPNFTLLQIKGFYLEFKGKLGRGGNSRKSKLILKKGLFSQTNKCLPMDLHKWDVWTKTGSVGCTFKVFY